MSSLAQRTYKTLLLDESSLNKAIQILVGGGIIGIPTETVYGLAGNAFDGEACSSIYRAKGRPSDNPLIVHIGEREMLEKIVQPTALTPTIQTLMDKFWPGPLTFLLPKLQSGRLADVVTCGLDTVCVRMPSHPLALRLIKEAGIPLAAPSANSSGRPSPTTARHVLDDLDGKIEAVLDGGPCSVGVESTVLDMFHPNGPIILRPGGVSYESLAEFIPNLKVHSKDCELKMEERPSTPGMKYRHYSPTATVILFEGPLEEQRIEIRKRIQSSTTSIGYMRIGGDESNYNLNGSLIDNLNGNSNSNNKSNDNTTDSIYPNLHIYELGNSPAEIASRLYDGLRSLDSIGVTEILVEGVDETKEGLAIMNRLEKAASQIVKV